MSIGIMQQLDASGSAGFEGLRVSEEEAKAMMQLRARLADNMSGPSLGEVSRVLGITEQEALALLTQVRSQNAVAAAEAGRRAGARGAVPSYVWPFAGVLAMLWIGVIGMLGSRFLETLRPSSPVFAPAAAEPAVGFVPPSPIMPAERGIVQVESPDGKVIIRREGNTTTFVPIESAREAQAAAEAEKRLAEAQQRNQERLNRLPEPPAAPTP
jgi:hypothetical protein